MEIWKDIRGYEGIYQISSLGRVKSFHGQTKILKPIYSPDGYLQLTLSKNTGYFKRKIHRLVAEAFIPNYDNKPMVNHIDRNRSNNNVSNLEWVTAKENSIHATKTPKIKKSFDYYVRELAKSLQKKKKKYILNEEQTIFLDNLIKYINNNRPTLE